MSKDHFQYYLTLSQTTNFRLFRTERVSRPHNFEFDKSGRNFSKCVENTVGKGEIARNEQSLLFPQCFQKDFNCRHVKNQGLFGKEFSNIVVASALIHAFLEFFFTALSIIFQAFPHNHCQNNGQW